MATLFFILIGAISLAAAVGVVSSRVPVHSALFLLVNFATLAVMYITLDAQFLAATQIIIYAGGIVILILFVIMLIGHESDEETSPPMRPLVPFVGIGLGALLALVMAISMRRGFAGVTPDGVVLQGGAPKAIGMELFTQYILPFELVAVLLLVALIGALLLARRPGWKS